MDLFSLFMLTWITMFIAVYWVAFFNVDEVKMKWYWVVYKNDNVGKEILVTRFRRLAIFINWCLSRYHYTVGMSRRELYKDYKGLVI